MLWDTRCHMKNGYYGPINVIHGAHVRVEKNSLHINSRKRKPRRASVLSSVSNPVHNKGLLHYFIFAWVFFNRATKLKTEFLLTQNYFQTS